MKDGGGAGAEVRVVGTAGHVDHGKSTLVRALTGTEPDRLAEERRRGLTIDLGFAWRELPSGRVVSFVDVPGHVRFLKNMLAGAGGVEACVFVVAATEGWKPQSEDHLRILDLLGISEGVVAMTKVSAAGPELTELCRAEIDGRVAGTFLEGAPVVAVDTPAGVGIDELTSAVDELVARTPRAADTGRPRLWIDRAFTIRGAGTVVTGTLTGGTLTVGDELVVVPGPPPTRRPLGVRVRGLESLGQPLPTATPGRRLAVNLTGAAATELSRGQALVRPDQWFASTTVDAALTVPADVPRPVTRKGAFHLHAGSGAWRIRLRALGAEQIEPGTSAAVRIHLPTPLPLLPGDRFVVRELGRAETIGGGEVLDVAPVLPAARARPDRSVARVVRERGWVDAALLERLTGEHTDPNVGRWVVDPDVLAAARSALRADVEQAGPLGVDLGSLDERDRAVLSVVDGVTVERERARMATAEDDGLDGHPFVQAAASSPFAPPDPRDAGVEAAELRELVRRGLLVECGSVWFGRDAIERAADIVAELLSAHPEGVTVSDVREALGTSRRYALPLLAHLDGSGMTRRRGDRRIAGPLLRDVAAHAGRTT